MTADKSFRRADYLDGVFLDHHQVFDGKVYGIPNGDSPRVLFYNTAVWRSAGAPDPNELEARGQWTWDAFLAALREGLARVGRRQGVGHARLPHRHRDVPGCA